MGNILSLVAGARPVATVASIDTAELFLRRLPKGLRRRVEEVTRRRAHIEPRRNSAGRWLGARLIINRPTKDALRMMSGLVGKRLGCCVHRVDIALDFRAETAWDATRLADWLDQHIVVKWRPRWARKLRIGNTVEWARGMKTRNVNCYPKTGDVVRLEMKFFNAGAVRRAGLDRLEGLDQVCVRKLVNRYLKAERLTERYIIDVVRKTYKDDMARYLKNKRGYSPFTDRYRSGIPRRVRAMLERTDMQEITGSRHTEKISLDWLNIPKRVTLR